MAHKYNNGSEWRIWDLHVHTKGTNKNDQFSSATFDDFCEELFEKIQTKSTICMLKEKLKRQVLNYR